MSATTTPAPPCARTSWTPGYGWGSISAPRTRRPGTWGSAWPTGHSATTSSRSTGRDNWAPDRQPRITGRRWAGSLVRREQNRQVVDVPCRRKHRVPAHRGGITGARYLGRDEPGHHRGRERRAVPPGHPGKVLLRRPLRRLVVGVLAGGVGVDQPFAGRVDVHPAAEVAEPRLVLPVGSDRADADHPVEGRREELPVRVVIAGRRDQGELLMPFMEEVET